MRKPLLFLLVFLDLWAFRSWAEQNKNKLQGDNALSLPKNPLFVALIKLHGEDFSLLDPRAHLFILDHQLSSRATWSNGQTGPWSAFAAGGVDSGPHQNKAYRDLFSLTPFSADVNDAAGLVFSQARTAIESLMNLQDHKDDEVVREETQFRVTYPVHLRVTYTSSEKVNVAAYSVGKIDVSVDVPLYISPKFIDPAFSEDRRPQFSEIQTLQKKVGDEETQRLVVTPQESIQDHARLAEALKKAAPYVIEKKIDLAVHTQLGALLDTVGEEIGRLPPFYQKIALDYLKLLRPELDEQQSKAAPSILNERAPRSGLKEITDDLSVERLRYFVEDFAPVLVAHGEVLKEYSDFFHGFKTLVASSDSLEAVKDFLGKTEDPASKGLQTDGEGAFVKNLRNALLERLKQRLDNGELKGSDMALVLTRFEEDPLRFAKKNDEDSP